MGAVKVLVVDDDRTVRNVICRALSEEYETVTAENGLDGIEKVQSENPDFVLLDVEMPGLNGYEVCDRLKQNPATQDKPVLFLSSHSSLRERMLGYEMGATDYIVKPFATDELLAKLRLLGQFKRDREALDLRAQSASATAFVAMRGSSELGLAIQFIEATYNAADFDTIARRFFDVTNQLGLNCSLMFQTRLNRQFFSARGTVSPLEQEVMATLYDAGKRFNDFGCRTQINYSRVALLVKNMPLDDQEAYGRYKDFLPTMLGSTDAKIKALDTEWALVEQTRNLTHSFGVVRETLVQVGSNLQSTQSEVLLLLRQTIEELDDRIPRLGLEDDQEKYLITTLDGALQTTHGIIESGESARASFQTVCRLLEHLSERQQALLKGVIEQPAPCSPHAGGASQDQDITGDVELF
ncbi:MAG: response regulator [Alcanivorax sp.]|nr:response regulator [Ketobacter sp.]TNC89092.1 MAG: response regulator [Alcanivorax sp.]